MHFYVQKRGWNALCCVLMLSAAGCGSSQRVENLRTVCKRVDDPIGRAVRLDFRSDFEAYGLADRQLLYQVWLVDRNVRPVPSRSGKYEMKDGGVGATKTVMVFDPVQKLTNQAVSIPVKELRVEPEQLPLRAYIAVQKVGGEQLAAVTCRIPIQRAEQLQPAMELPPGSENAVWFMREADPDRLPILRGPFDTPAEAMQSVSLASDEPRGLEMSSYAWFVPFWNSDDSGRELWFGPCCCEEDIHEVKIRMQQNQSVIEQGFEPGVPTQLRLEEGLPKVRETKTSQDLAGF